MGNNEKFKFKNGLLDEIYITFNNYCLDLKDISEGNRVVYCFNTWGDKVGAIWEVSDIPGTPSLDVNLELEMYKRGRIALELIDAVFNEGLMIKKKEPVKYKNRENDSFTCLKR